MVSLHLHYALFIFSIVSKFRTKFNATPTLNLFSHFCPKNKSGSHTAHMDLLWLCQRLRRHLFVKLTTHTQKGSLLLDWLAHLRTATGCPSQKNMKDISLPGLLCWKLEVRAHSPDIYLLFLMCLSAHQLCLSQCNTSVIMLPCRCPFIP